MQSLDVLAQAATFEQGLALRRSLPCCCKQRKHALHAKSCLQHGSASPRSTNRPKKDAAARRKSEREEAAREKAAAAAARAEGPEGRAKKGAATEEDGVASQKKASDPGR